MGGAPAKYFQHTASRYDTIGTVPEWRLVDTDGVDPSGRHRIRGSTIDFYIERATAASWGTVASLMQFTNTGDTGTDSNSCLIYGSLIVEANNQTVTTERISLQLVKTLNLTANTALQMTGLSVELSLGASQNANLTGTPGYVGIDIRPSFDGTSVVTNARGLNISTFTVPANITLTTFYGIYITDIGTVTGSLVTQYGIYLENISSASTLNRTIFTAGGITELRADNIGVTPTDVLDLWNNTDAATGAQQYSPALRWHGEGWSTDGAGASQNVDWRAYVVPVQGAANPTANLIFQSSINDGAFATRLTIGSDGRLSSTGITLTGSLNFDASTVVYANNADDSSLAFNARDNGVGSVQVGSIQGAANPYWMFGRDDTGVALNAVTDMVVLQAGGGTGNEAANFGLGISLRIGNAASEVEERGRIDLVLVTATDASEDTRLNFYTQLAGAANLAFYVDQGGQLYADLAGGAGNVTLFDDYDDALVLRQGIRERRLDTLERLGVVQRKDTGSGWLVAIQPMLYLLAGGVYQTRQMIDDMRVSLEERIAVLEEANRILQEHPLGQPAPTK